MSDDPEDGQLNLVFIGFKTAVCGSEPPEQALLHVKAEGDADLAPEYSKRRARVHRGREADNRASRFQHDRHSSS